MSSIGPQLPPRLCQQNKKEEIISPSVGPQIPSHLLKKGEPDGDSIDPEVSYNNINKIKLKDGRIHGPALAPKFMDKPNEVKIGPVLPSHYSRGTVSSHDIPHKRQGENSSTTDEDNEEIVGPCLPTNVINITDEDRIKKEFEERAKAMKNKLTGKYDTDNKMERETWMLELPPEISKNFGLGPRSFRSKAPELGDRSVWTDTPADKERKKMERREEADNNSETNSETRKRSSNQRPTEQEIEMQKRVAEYNNATRPQSLMEIHQEKRKKTGETTNVRRPFDRERDLSLHRANPKEKDQFIKQAQGLNNKFSKGSYSNKFL